jgi:hypothetical protein
MSEKHTLIKKTEPISSPASSWRVVSKALTDVMIKHGNPREI